MEKEVLAEIHRYWFGELNSPDDFDRDRIRQWFRQSDDMDRHIRETYGPLLREAASREWNLADLSREEAIGLVVLFDQFPRNIFRTSGEAFAYDAKALAIARLLVNGGVQRFFWIERLSLSLPFQHNEDVADQDYAVLLSADGAVNGPESMREASRIYLDFATKHRDIIRKFGRYPHRNAMLGRQSTPEEEAFLKDHGRGF